MIEVQKYRADAYPSKLNDEKKALHCNLEVLGEYSLHYEFPVVVAVDEETIGVQIKSLPAGRGKAQHRYDSLTATDW